MEGTAATNGIPCTASSYFQYVQEVSKYWQGFQNLAAFMDESLLAACLHLSHQEQATTKFSELRMTKIDVVVVTVLKDVSGSTFVQTDHVKILPQDNPQVIKESTNTLNTLLTRSSVDTSSGLSTAIGRIVLVEDLSRDMIEQLGSVYKLDPYIFAGHLRGVGYCYQTGTAGGALPDHGQWWQTAREPLHSLDMPESLRSMWTFEQFRLCIPPPNAEHEMGERGERILLGAFHHENAVVRRSQSADLPLLSGLILAKERITICRVKSQQVPTVLYLFDPLMELDPHPV